ncbi:olfactory receptor 13H1-like [Podarcis muralis]
MQNLGDMNETDITEFVLIAFSGHPKIRTGLAALMSIIYLGNVVGNGLIVFVVTADPRLHNPMYFFLCNLSIIDIGLCTFSVPQSIANCLVDRPVMPFASCYIQMYAGIYLGGTECFLLAVMAYDRYVAISSPLRYMIIMNWRVCVVLAIAPWTMAFLLAIVPCLAKPAHFCGHNEVDHFACELTALMKLMCSDMAVSQLIMYFTSTFTVLFPFCLILFSYSRIIVTILKIDSSGGRKKAFSTCGSHLAVVVVFFGNAIVQYIKPQSKDNQDSDKFIFVFNAAIIPMLNPLIYTLRNQDVLGALKRLTQKKL